MDSGEKSILEDDDHISRLPDAILGEIVSLLPTKDGACTQVLSSRWRPIWRAAALNLDLHYDFATSIRSVILTNKISGILSSHPGPGRRFSIPLHCLCGDAHRSAANLDGWLRSPALDGLRELEFHCGFEFLMQRWKSPAALRFSPTLRVASFGGCRLFPDGDDAAGELRMPVLEQLSLLHVRISEGSLHALLAGCPALQSLMLTNNNGCSCIRIVSPTLRSFGLICAYDEIDSQHLILEDVPSLERLLFLGQGFRAELVISVISAPKLYVLGQLPGVDQPRIKFGTTVFKGSRVVKSMPVLQNVKVLALTQNNLSLDVAIDFMKCLRCLENLYIETKMPCLEPRYSGKTNSWSPKYHDLLRTLDIRLKKIVVTFYQGNEAHVNFANFFVLNARVLESMVLHVYARNIDKAWTDRQHVLLQLEDRVSKSARFDFVPHFDRPSSFKPFSGERVHDLSTTDPFVRFDVWA